MPVAIGTDLWEMIIPFRYYEITLQREIKQEIQIIARKNEIDNIAVLSTPMQTDKV